MGRQQNLFVGHVGEDCVYMAQEKQHAYKTNRDWHLDTSSSDSSNNNMNMDEDSETSDTTRLTSNNNNDNNDHIVNRDDYNKTDEYEATDPDSFEAKIIYIASCTHDDMAHNTVLGV
jgi:Rieske Fe-S protein